MKTNKKKKIIQTFHMRCDGPHFLNQTESTYVVADIVNEVLGRDLLKMEAFDVYSKEHEFFTELDILTRIIDSLSKNETKLVFEELSSRYDLTEVKKSVKYIYEKK